MLAPLLRVTDSVFHRLVRSMLEVTPSPRSVTVPELCRVEPYPFVRFSEEATRSAFSLALWKYLGYQYKFLLPSFRSREAPVMPTTPAPRVICCGFNSDPSPITLITPFDPSKYKFRPSPWAISDAVLLDLLFVWGTTDSPCGMPQSFPMGKKVAMTGVRMYSVHREYVE